MAAWAQAAKLATAWMTRAILLTPNVLSDANKS
jgi:hypothetical protein